MDPTDYRAFLAEALQNPEKFRAQFGNAAQPLDDQDALLQRRSAQARAMAQALMNQPAQRYETGQGGMFGALGDTLRGLRGGFQAADADSAEAEQRALLPQKETAAIGENRLKLALQGVKMQDEKDAAAAKAQQEMDLEALRGKGDAAKLAEERRYHDLLIQKTKEDAAAAAAKAATDKTEQGQKTAAELRKELMGLPPVKALQDVTASYEKIKSTATKPSPAGDISLITAYMKMLDPGSTVREGEFANAQNAAGVPERVVSLYNSVVNGKKLDDPQRADFVNQAANLYAAHYNRYKPLADEYGGLADRAGVPRGDVVLNLGLQAPPPQVSPGAKVTPSGKPYVKMQKNTATGAVRYLDATGQVVE